jgi:hypothetical protein
MKGFIVAADAIVPCKECGATEGVPCKPLKGEELKAGYVHFGRRVARLLLSAGNPAKRAAFEAAALKELRAYLKETQS